MLYMHVLVHFFAIRFVKIVNYFYISFNNNKIFFHFQVPDKSTPRSKTLKTPVTKQKLESKQTVTPRSEGTKRTKGKLGQTAKAKRRRSSAM